MAAAQPASDRLSSRSCSSVPPSAFQLIVAINWFTMPHEVRLLPVPLAPPNPLVLGRDAAPRSAVVFQRSSRASAAGAVSRPPNHTCGASFLIGVMALRCATPRLAPAAEVEQAQLAG